MIIPTTFQLGGVVWHVKRVKRLTGKYGHCDIKKQEIKILDTVAPELKEWTFCHELTHCLLATMGKSLDDHNEEFIDGFSALLHQYMNSAK